MKAKQVLLILAALVLSIWSISRISPGAVAAAAPAGHGPGGDSGEPAVVTGQVKLDGQATANKPISMTKDPECMKMQHGGAQTEEVVAGSDGSLGNVIVYVSEGLAGRNFDPPAVPVVIEQKGCTYRPHVLAMQANQKLQISNGDPTSHNIHPIPVNNREWNKSQPPGEPPLEATFAREEIAIPVKCNEHPWMRAYIAVFKHPFFSVTGKDGHFELKNLPPGQYTLTAWHETFGTVEQKITVGAKETKTVSFTFKPRRSYGSTGQ